MMPPPRSISSTIRCDIEPRRTALGDHIEQQREVWIDQPVTIRRRLSARQEQSARGLEALELAGRVGDRARQPRVDSKAVARESDSGLEQLAPGPRAKALMQRPQPGDAARHAARQVPLFRRRGRRLGCGARGTGERRARGLPVHVPVCTSGRRLSEIERCALALPIAYDGKAAAAEVPGFGIDDGEHERDRHGGIDRVASTRELGHAGGGCQRGVRHHQEIACTNGGFADG
jgi:hypothetical protein